MKKAFTLIELIVTISIIVLMILVAIPSFGRYGKEMQFRQTVDQANIFIKEASVSAMNPEQGIKSYIIKFDFSNNKLVFQKKLDNDSIVDIKEMELSKKQSFVAQNDYQFIFCDVIDRGVCQKQSSTGTVQTFPDVPGVYPSPNDYDDLFQLKDDNVNRVVMFKAFNNPFRVTTN